MTVAPNMMLETSHLWTVYLERALSNLPLSEAANTAHGGARGDRSLTDFRGRQTLLPGSDHADSYRHWSATLGVELAESCGLKVRVTSGNSSIPTEERLSLEETMCGLT